MSRQGYAERVMRIHRLETELKIVKEKNFRLVGALKTANLFNSSSGGSAWKLDSLFAQEIDALLKEEGTE